MAVITITDFTTRVRTQIRDNGATQAFQDTELQQFIQDAILEYSRWRPRKRSFALQLQAGVTSYTLPTDWMIVDQESFDRSIRPSPLPDPSAYALPYVYLNQPLGGQLNSMRFDWYNDDQTLTLGSAPVMAYTLTFNYFAYHTVDTSGTTIPVPSQYYALLPAYEKALRALATDYAVKLQKYKVGGRYGIDVDDSQIAKVLQVEADTYGEKFRKEIILRPYATSGGGDDDWQ